jgi:hypothetical protein
MQDCETHADDSIPWPVWLVAILIASSVGDALARFLVPPWNSDHDGVMWSLVFASLLGHSMLNRGTKKRRDALHYFAVVAIIPLLSGILAIIGFESDERVIRGDKHFGETTFMLAFGVLCTVAWLGLKSSICDRYFESTKARIHPHVLTCLIVVFSLSSAHLYFRNHIEKRYAEEMKPTVTQVFVRDSASLLPLDNIQMLSSQAAPLGLDDNFRQQHQAFSGSTMIDKYQAAFVSLKTAIAEPLKLRFGSDGYEPAEVIIKPGHEGRIELGLKPVAKKSASETRP